MIVGKVMSTRRYTPVEDKPRVIFHNGAVYPIAVDWRDAATESEARAVAKAARSLYAFHAKGKQVALLTSPDHLAGKVLFATGLSLLHMRADQNWVGFYQINSTPAFPQGYYWLIVVRDRRVVRDEVLSQEDAIEAAAALRADGLEYSQFIAPPQIDDGHEERLANLLDPLTDTRFRASGFTVDFSRIGEAMPPISGVWALTAIVVAIGLTWSVTRWLQPVQIRVERPAPVTVEVPVLVTAPVKAVPDPGAFLASCTEATGSLLALGNPVGANLACFAPTGQQPTWTASAAFAPGWPMPSVSAQLTLPPYQLISSAESGIPHDQTLAALTKAIPAALVKIDAKVSQVPLAAPNAAPPSPLTTLQGTAAKTGEAASRAVTDITLTSKVAPAAWSAALARTPVAIERVTRDPTGLWTVYAKVL